MLHIVVTKTSCLGRYLTNIVYLDTTMSYSASHSDAPVAKSPPHGSAPDTDLTSSPPLIAKQSQPSTTAPIYATPSKVIILVTAVVVNYRRRANIGSKKIFFALKPLGSPMRYSGSPVAMGGFRSIRMCMGHP